MTTESDHVLATRLAVEAGRLLVRVAEEMWSGGAHPWQVMDTGDIASHRFLMEALARERPDDIPLLVRHYMEFFSRENNVRPKRITPAALDLLRHHRWKGNIRELRNAVERTIIMTPGDVIDVADLPSSVRSPGGGRGAAEADASKAATLRAFKDTSERAYLVAKLRENGWNISKTAEVIDTPRSNLYKKLEQYGIKQEVDG